jgi:hypothetical protein
MAKRKAASCDSTCMPGTVCGVILLIIGILFLLVDLGKWNFWNIQWWTVLFLLWGIFTLWKK